MSDNPEKFNALRKAAYSYVNEHGKDAEGLRRTCEEFMRRWCETRGLTGTREQDDRALIDSVVRWTMNRYNRPRYRPKRSREERAATFLIAPGLLEMSGEHFGRASIRNAARLSDQSKSTVARHLIRQGIAPRRDAKIRKLPKTGQQLVRILDATFDRRGDGILQLDRLAAAVWDGEEPRHVPVTTQASRRRKLATLLVDVSKAGVGYSIAVMDDVCGILRGRRFQSPKDTATWIAEKKMIGRYPAIQHPDPVTEPAQDYFWADPVVIDVMRIIDMGVTGHFYPVEKLNAIFRFERLLIDMTPVWPWVERAYHSFAGDDMAENLSNLADKITDPGIRKATRRLAQILHELKTFMGAFPVCYDAFQTVDFVLGVMDKTAEASPESFARLAYIRDWFEAFEVEDDYLNVREHLSKMLEFEKAGTWQAPNAETLAQYQPVANMEVGAGETRQNESKFEIL
ncbi:hypothetical protein GCM10011491_34790 [Brucella endophytica]|uniref:Uncharacterized protein n=1 Tax=Brucella endophytica TaxID=1963359 RepID=A0A916SMH0_9HYPH|nr:hypothetical protein [Brucella endophytica]GGB03660.1 hypothetical protein GCM10011491_34790 [Brucella endophytica]